MKIKVTKEWCMAMAKHEADVEVGAGLIAADPFFDEEKAPAEATTEPWDAKTRPAATRYVRSIHFVV